MLRALRYNPPRLWAYVVPPIEPLAWVNTSDLNFIGSDRESGRLLRVWLLARLYIPYRLPAFKSTLATSAGLGREAAGPGTEKRVGGSGGRGPVPPGPAEGRATAAAAASPAKRFSLAAEHRASR